MPVVKLDWQRREPVVSRSSSRRTSIVSDICHATRRSLAGAGTSHIGAEVDATGGAMAKVADKTPLHVRMLNTSKGPAVQAKRSQQDKGLYALAMKETLELQPNLELLQDEAIGLEVG